MARKKTLAGGTTVATNPTMTTQRVVEKKKQAVSSAPVKKINVTDLPVYDPGAEKDTDFFVDNIFDTDDYEDL